MALGTRSQPSHHAITIGRPPAEVGAAFYDMAANRHFAPASVTLEPAPMERGTEVHVIVVEGGIGRIIRSVRGKSRDQQARQVLREVKAQLECGEALQVAPQPEARGRISSALQRVISERLSAAGRR
jgi:hypothetical protein